MENEDLQERPPAAHEPSADDPAADASAGPLVVPEAVGEEAAAEVEGELIAAAAMASDAAEEDLEDAVVDEAVAEALDEAADDALEDAVVAHAVAEVAIGDAAEDLALADALHEAAVEEANAGDVETAAADEALAEELEVVAAESATEAVVSEGIAEEALAVAVEDRAEAEALHEAAAGSATDALVEVAVAEELVEAAAEVEAQTAAVVEPDAQPEADADGSKADDSLTRGPGDWYVVHTYSGYENKVKTNLHQRIASMQMEDKIFDVVIPMEDVMEIKGGKKQVVQRKVFPGYLLVRMIYDNDSWYVVRNTPGVTGFVSSGTGTKPTPLSKREVEKILSVPKADERKKPEYRLEWEEGDVVRIIAGPFADFTGTISEINVEQSKLRVMVNIFDRETPVELAFDQVAKA